MVALAGGFGASTDSAIAESERAMGGGGASSGSATAGSMAERGQRALGQQKIRLGITAPTPRASGGKLTIIMNNYGKYVGILKNLPIFAVY